MRAKIDERDAEKEEAQANMERLRELAAQRAK